MIVRMNVGFKVTVIIPIYNSDKFLEEAVESVLNQSIVDSTEIVLVDDGSTDNSYGICKKYSDKYSNIKLLTGENRGVSVARNRGLEEATGKYIFFMDSDDTIDKDFLSSSYEIAENNNSDFVVLGNYFSSRIRHNLLVFPTWAMFIKKSFLDNNKDIKFPEGIQPCEDGLFSHQLLSITDRVSCNTKAVYNYRQHEEQNHVRIDDDSWKVLKDIPKWFDILEKFYEKHNLLPKKAMYLAKFVEHEPFELRYLGMNLDDSQKDFLHKIIKEFFHRKVSLYLSSDANKYLTKKFLYFLKAESFKEFEDYRARIEKEKEYYSRMLEKIPIKFIRGSFQRKLKRWYVKK